MDSCGTLLLTISACSRIRSNPPALLAIWASRGLTTVAEGTSSFRSAFWHRPFKADRVLLATSARSCGCSIHFGSSDRAPLRRWVEKNADEAENVTWILANTKPCPKYSSVSCPVSGSLNQDLKSQRDFDRGQQNDRDQTQTGCCARHSRF